MKLHRLSLLSTLVSLGVLGVGLLARMPVAQAQAILTSAEIYTLQNEVTLNEQSTFVGARMVPQDSLRTGARSRAELIFNEGTLVRTGEGTTFRFPAGQRSFELIDGSTLLMIRPGLGASLINTPEAEIVASGTALFVQHDAASNSSVVGVLTESPAGPVTVTSRDGEVSVQLDAGQFVSVANGAVGFIEDFILPVFYDTVDMAVGLAPGDDAFVSQQPAMIQETLNAVRAESLPPFTAQIEWIGGLCEQGIGTFEQLLQQAPLVQWLLPPTHPPTQISLKMPETDVSVMPLRSLTGMAWMSNYCLAQRPSTNPATAEPTTASPTNTTSPATASPTHNSPTDNSPANNSPTNNSPATPSP
ncbi:MAG: FecR domain-containing protein [Cyanobacteria bacterium P01_A01_bin.116]